MTVAPEDLPGAITDLFIAVEVRTRPGCFGGGRLVEAHSVGDDIVVVAVLWRGEFGRFPCVAAIAGLDFAAESPDSAARGISGRCWVGWSALEATA